MQVESGVTTYLTTPMTWASFRHLGVIDLPLITPYRAGDSLLGPTIQVTSQRQEILHNLLLQSHRSERLLSLCSQVFLQIC